MTIDLRKYFLGNSETLEYELDLSGMELGGVKPFCAPAKVPKPSIPGIIMSSKIRS